MVECSRHPGKFHLPGHTCVKCKAEQDAQARNAREKDKKKGSR